MEKHFFNAHTDLEIGDKVNLKEQVFDQEVFTVYDIRTVFESRSRNVYFEFKLMDWNGIIFDGWLPRDKILYPIKGD